MSFQIIWTGIPISTSAGSTSKICPMMMTPCASSSSICAITSGISSGKPSKNGLFPTMYEYTVPLTSLPKSSQDISVLPQFVQLGPGGCEYLLQLLHFRTFNLCSSVAFQLGLLSCVFKVIAFLYP